MNKYPVSARRGTGAPQQHVKPCWHSRLLQGQPKHCKLLLAHQDYQPGAGCCMRAGHPHLTRGVWACGRHAGQPSRRGVYLSAVGLHRAGLQRAWHPCGSLSGGPHVRPSQGGAAALCALPGVLGQWHRLPGGAQQHLACMHLQPCRHEIGIPEASSTLSCLQ